MKIDLQLFSSAGVFPVHNNIFKINKLGRTELPADMVTIKDIETFEPGFESTIEEWTPMDLEGWARQAVTGKKLTLSLTGKRCYGDPGNDYVAGLMIATGQGVESELEWTMPSGAKLTFDCVIDVKKIAGGDSTAIDGLEIDILSDGKPVFTPAV
jgi:hypothetical protein